MPGQIGQAGARLGQGEIAVVEDVREDLGPRGRGMSDREVWVEAQRRSDQSRGVDPDDVGPEIAYPLIASDFAPAYALSAIAERRMGLREEMEESLRQLVTVNPALRGLADRIRSGRDNTFFIVDWGEGPEKIRVGPDGAIAAFAPVSRSDRAELRVSTERGSERWPVAEDYNRLADDLRWNNTEDIRIAKSNTGTLLFAGGAVALTVSDEPAAQIAGLAAMLAGAALKSTAGADTRQVEILPQRTYIAPATLPPGLSRVELAVPGLEGAKLTLPAVPSAGEGDLRIWYVRLPSRWTGWSDQTRVRYCNDETGDAYSRPDLPFVLGGRCLRTPTPALMEEYRAAGLPDGMTSRDVIELYRDEGIVLPEDGAGVPLGLHVLEGGWVVYTPPAGSAGFVRLYCQDRPPYQPRGELARRVLDRMRGVTRND